MRTSVDTGFLSNLRQQAGHLADGTIFASALSVAGDGSASIPARAFALLTLQSIVAPSSPSTYAEATSGFDPAGTPACSRITRLRTDAALRPGSTPLPADYVAQAHALAAKLQRDATVPLLVRAAAQCPM
ncbi:MAG: hypothetical protein M3081_07195 [Gemmatimonadota bacterium]|nr:hypothetical protein [Gemmatimonadota bacterium]